jgi:hypothetical protein
MKSFLIYCLKEPDTGEIRYFGKTCRDIAERFSKHLSAKPNWHVSRWIHKLKQENKLPICEVLISGLTGQESCEEEIALIAWGRKKGLRLTNLTDGGEGRLGFKVSDETKKKISRGHIGRHVTAETKQKLREINLGKRLSEETKEKITLSVPRGEDHWTFGKSRNSETCDKISKALMGHKQSQEQIEKRKKSLPKGESHWTNRVGISEESLEKMRAAKIGKSLSDSARAKLSEFWKKKWAERKQCKALEGK